MGAGTPVPGAPIPGRYSPTLQHQNSTKLLINRFETLTTSPPPETPPLRREKSTYRHQYVYDYNRAANSLSTPDDKTFKSHKKEKSPIRLSIRNLLSVLKKGTSGLSKKKSDDKLGSASTVRRGSKEESRESRASNDISANESTAVNPYLNPRKRKKQTGSLLHLTRGSQLSPDTLVAPVWVTCNVTLEANKIVVSSFTQNMDLCIHEIMLTRCSDIRSLSISQLDPEEASQLERMPDGDKVKVFEVLFEGRGREKFAAKSVRERAGWISAIWDAILPAQEARGAFPNDDVPVVVPIADRELEDAYNSNLRPIKSPMPTPMSEVSTLLQDGYFDRSLPPLPPKSPLAPLSIPGNTPKRPPLETNVSSSTAPISPSIYPPTVHNSPVHPQLPHLVIPDQQTPKPPLLDRHSPTDVTVISPSTYPATSRTNSLAGSPVNTLRNSPAPPRLPPLAIPDQQTPKPPSLDRHSSTGRTIISQSTYPATARTSSLAGSPSNSCPNSPSVANLSQLSVVRQRLAQIERNHSELSAKSGTTTPTATRPSTPISPVERFRKSEASRPDANPRTSRSSRREVTKMKAEDPPTPTPQKKRKADVMPLMVDPLELMKLQHASGLAALHAPSKDDVLKISKDLAEVKGVLGGATGYPTVHQMVVGLDQRMQDDQKALWTIQQSLTALDGRITGAASDKQQTSRGNEDLARVLEGIQSQLSAGFPSILGRLTQFEETQEKAQEMNLKNIGASSSNDTDTKNVVDLGPVLEKLEGIRELCATGGSNQAPADSKSPEQLDNILSCIKEESEKRAVMSQQQADSVRYLNELNQWLEAFVNNGTSQIQGLAANVDELCKELGCNAQQPGLPVLPGKEGTPGLVNDIRQLVLGMQARDQNFAALQTAVHGLLEVLSASQMQKGQDTQAIAGLIDRQRHDQETLFRAFTDEIASEIKGERLRFVEAMKEATAINVQIHVEQFKQELSREVMGMTEEVGRLHREKQVVENQISDLFAFYTKQKQTSAPLGPNHVNKTLAPHPQQTQERRSNIPRSNHRPLPYPRQL
ncbi:hypothetical protein B0H34DRAFT_795616 [Crassisporium funariophilum]|nr:hypothetical protein B0H34DRAFT_795616 [Crassisporium funariophilum]